MCIIFLKKNVHQHWTAVPWTNSTGVKWSMPSSSSFLEWHGHRPMPAPWLFVMTASTQSLAKSLVWISAVDRSPMPDLSYTSPVDWKKISPSTKPCADSRICKLMNCFALRMPDRPLYHCHHHSNQVLPSLPPSSASSEPFLSIAKELGNLFSSRAQTAQTCLLLLCCYSQCGLHVCTVLSWKDSACANAR
jgi:hypothetical protein